MRTLLINLTRLGDLLQMQPLVHNLHAQGHIVDILCLENFQEAAKLLQGVANVHPFPASRILALANNDWRVSLAFIEESLSGLLAQSKYERVINMTSSMAARMLALRLAAKGARMDGYLVDPQGNSLPASLWGSLFEGAGQHRSSSPFNIVDAFAKSIQAFTPASPNTLMQPDEHTIHVVRHTLLHSLPSKDRLRCQGFVGIQLGASASIRQWPAEAFATLGKQLWEQHALMPILFGTKSEQALAEAYLATGAPACNHVGRTTLQSLTQLLCCTRILLTNDTGTMHLAAGLDIPCLAFFLATAQPWDTGPASNTSCILEPALSCHPCSYATPCQHQQACSQHIKAAHVWPLLNTWVETGKWQSHDALNAVARVWESVQDEKGYRNVRSLSGHEQDDRTLWLRVQQHVYSQFLDNIEGPMDYNAQAISPYAHGGQHFSETWKNTVAPKIQKAIRSCRQLLEQSKGFQKHNDMKLEKSFASTRNAVYTPLHQVDVLHALALMWQSTARYTLEEFSQAPSFITQFIHLLQAVETSIQGPLSHYGTEHA